MCVLFVGGAVKTRLSRPQNKRVALLKITERLGVRIVERENLGCLGGRGAFGEQANVHVPTLVHPQYS